MEETVEGLESSDEDMDKGEPIQGKLWASTGGNEDQQEQEEDETGKTKGSHPKKNTSKLGVQQRINVKAQARSKGKPKDKDGTDLQSPSAHPGLSTFLTAHPLVQLLALRYLPRIIPCSNPRLVVTFLHKQEQNKLEELRIQIAEDPSNANKEKYMKMEHEVKEKEMMEKHILRRRSRVHWLAEGEACTKYFFSMLKSKQAQGRITHRDKGGRAGAEEERDEVLEMIDRTVSQEDNGLLTKEPDKKEIQETIDSMASGKSRGEDGVTIEVLKEVWEFVEERCEKFIKAIWRSKRIGIQHKVAVTCATGDRSL
ncbi:hypothetical protein R1sor_004308 [Riccia sorocarpa]|uniref:Uncharacterized protein n=1 Tax=Riccia sorocarpa TaxID=122646 RepID=A0ABD3HJU5_9MARC